MPSLSGHSTGHLPQKGENSLKVTIEIKMNKKVIGIIVGLLILAAGAAAFYFYWQNRSPKVYAYQMTGEVKEVNGEKIKVAGFLDLSNGERKRATIEFIITPQTRLTNHTLLLGGHKPGEMYTPQTTETPGSLADFVPNVRIDSIKARENLAKTPQAVATEVDYETFTFGNSQ